jgi:mannitol/fructose-specific phosphotransferase system IIA component (Ntr-type)
MDMDLGNLFGPIKLRAENRWEAIDELIHHLAVIDRIKIEHTSAIAASVRKREFSMTTGIGYGIGIPHASTDLVNEVTGVVGSSLKGIQFEALDGQPVNLVILFLVPQGELQKYMHTLANIAKFVHREDFRDDLRRRFL